ncbi:major facilitator superfamily domain-containing protein [Hyaloraphidium curvatum]|nr:major facilitator superfamily domain-containing protein [Hyaloraphidium curvatum]
MPAALDLPAAAAEPLPPAPAGSEPSAPDAPSADGASSSAGEGADAETAIDGEPDSGAGTLKPDKGDPSATDGASPKGEGDVEAGDAVVEDAKPPAPPALDYPDDSKLGYGAVVILANFSILFLAAGLQYSSGVFIRNYYTLQYFGPGTSYSVIAFLGSLIGLGFPLFGPIAGTVSAYFGPRPVVLVMVTVQALGLIIASLAPSVALMLVFQGLVFGLGECFVYIAGIAALQQYFLKRRGLAIGLAVSGSGFGGLALSSVTQILIDNLGIPWTLRTLGLALLGVGLVGGALMRPRVPSGRQAHKEAGVRLLPKLDFSVFRNKYFVVLYVSSAISNFGYFVPFYFISSYSTSIGLSANLSSLALGIMNGASAFGRIGMGGIADRIGYLNAFTISQLTTPIAILLIWSFAKSFGVIVLFSIVYGFAAGGFISIMPPMMVSLFGGGSGLVAMLGMQMSSGLVASLAGPPIAGAITDANTVVLPDGTRQVTTWLPTIMYAGFTMLVGNLALIWIRGDRTGWKLAAKI